MNFNNAGTEFLSASYDKVVKLWDTETGMNLYIFFLIQIFNNILLY